MHRSSLTREQLEHSVAEMSPAAHAVFDDMTAGDDGAEPGLPEDFDRLTPAEKSSVRDAADLRKQLADAKAVEDEQRADVLRRKHRGFWVASVVYSLGCLIAVTAVLVHIYTAPVEPAAADTVLTTPEDVTRYEAANPPPPVPGEAAAISIPTGVFTRWLNSPGPTPTRYRGNSGSDTPTTCPRTSPKASSFLTPKTNQRSKRCTARGKTTKN